MTIYQKATRKVQTLIARERAPLAATEDMFDEDPELSSYGTFKTETRPVLNKNTTRPEVRKSYAFDRFNFCVVYLAVPFPIAPFFLDFYQMYRTFWPRAATHSPLVLT